MPSMERLSISHWTEAIGNPRFDPDVVIVDFIKVVVDKEGKYGLYDTNNCAQCQRLVKPILAVLENPLDDEFELANRNSGA